VNEDEDEEDEGGDEKEEEEEEEDKEEGDELFEFCKPDLAVIFVHPTTENTERDR